MLLKSGSNGDNVRKIQLKLGSKADGAFGPITEAKVKAWQSDNGMLPNGVVNDEMWNKLFGADISQNDQTLTGELQLDKLNGKIPDNVLLQIPDTAVEFAINSNLRLAHFLTQCGHESGGFKFLTENLNYSKDGLKKIFSEYFPGDLAQGYERNPEKIGSRVYANRMGNGDEASGDGYKYRGRGYIQLTGKDNYASFSDFIGEDVVANPDLVATKYPLASAAFYFASQRLWQKCDKGADEDVVTEVTKAVNGGTNGLADRLKHFNEYYSVLR
jgi:putative chitinase